jgi:hypothetical protein
MSRMAEQQLYIHGGYTSATSGRTFETINPANGEVLASVQAAGREDVDRAVESARRGQKNWAAMTAMERSRILRRAVDILRERNDELAKLETLDTGKAYSETSTVDIVTGADVLEYYAGLIPALEGSQIPLRETSFVYTRREPLGVVAGIGAWNYPIQIALWKSAPALAAGNAMIFKPSEVTPLTALKLAEIYTEAGLPDGVFNVLPGVGAETGQYLTELPDAMLDDLHYDSYTQDCADRRAHSCSVFQMNNAGFHAEITLEKQNLVFFSVPYDDGFTAYVNGEKADILRVDEGLMAVLCPAGASSIDFVYQADGLSASRVVTAVAIPVWVVYVAYFVRRKRRSTGTPAEE